jgi:hypothetical protein
VGSIGLPASRPVALRFSPQEEWIRVTAVKVGAFLVSYCVRARIPLPRNSDKEITMAVNSIILSVTTFYAEAPARDDGTGMMRFSRVRG